MPDRLATEVVCKVIEADVASALTETENDANGDATLVERVGRLLGRLAPRGEISAEQKNRVAAKIGVKRRR